VTTLQKLELRRSGIITLKFALATVSSLALASLFAPEGMLSAAFFALLTLQPTLMRGLRISLEQILATLVGTAVTVLVVFVLRQDPTRGLSYLQAGLAIGVTALVCLRMFSQGPMLTALFTVLFFSLMPSLLNQSFWDTLHIRALTVLIGVGCSTVLNLGFSLLRHRDRLFIGLVAVSRDIRDLLLELEEVVAPAPEPPDRARLRGLLPRFRDVFEALGKAELDIEEVRREALRFRRGAAADAEQRAAYLRGALVRKMSNVSHYAWGTLLNLLNNEVAGPRHVQLKEALSANVLKYRQAHRGLEQTEPFPMPTEGLDGLGRRLAESLQQREGDQSANRLAASVSLLSSMLHMEIGVLEYAGHVRSYVELLRGAPRSSRSRRT